MQHSSSLIVSAVLLVCIISATAIAAHFATPVRGEPSVQTVSATTLTKTSTSVSNSTAQLSVSLSFPNGTRLLNGSLRSGTTLANVTAGQFVLDDLAPGNYQLNLTGVNNTYLPPISAHVSPGSNFLNLTVYQLLVFRLIASQNLSFNGTQPSPTISVSNSSAVQIVIQNNTTQVFNVAVVSALYNNSADNVLFDSLSNTISAGGSVVTTFIVSEVGTFYYQSMTGNQAREGEWGYFTVIP